MNYFDYDEPYEYREDWENHIQEVIKAVVDEKCSEVYELNVNKDKVIKNQSDEITTLKTQVKELQQNQSLKVKFELLSKMVNKDNIVSIIHALGLKKTNDESYIRGMSDKYRFDIELVLLYYNDKNTILDLFDLFGIEYNKTLRNFILPRDYDKELVGNVLKDIRRSTIMTNSCYLGGNFGFWIGEYVRDYSKEKISKVVPLQEIFMNPVIKDYFDVIVDYVKKDKYNGNIFYGITKYQEFTDDQILNLAKYLPINDRDIYDVHNDFIKRHKDILFNDDDFCKDYFKFIGTNRYSVFAVHNFKKDYQIKFLKTIEINKAIEVIREMQIGDSEKKELILQISKGE